MKRILVSDGKAYVVDERWVTIGGEDEDGGGQHVLIKENGTIVAGFGTGKNVRNAFSGGKADTPEKANEAVAKKKRGLPPLDMPKNPAQARKMIESGELDLINKRLKEQGKADTPEKANAAIKKKTNKDNINAAGFEKKQLKLAGQRVGDIEAYEDKEGNLYWVRPSKDDRISPIRKEDGGHILQGKYNEKGEFTSVGKSIGYKTDGELKNIFERMSSYNTAKESVLNYSFQDPKAFAEAEAEAKAKLKEAKRMAKEAPDDEYAKKRLSEMNGYVEGYKERREKGQIPKSWEEREAERKRERLDTSEKANNAVKIKSASYEDLENKLRENRKALNNTTDLKEKRRLINENHDLMTEMDNRWNKTEKANKTAKNKYSEYGGYTPPEFHGTKEEIFKQATEHAKKIEAEKKRRERAQARKTLKDIDKRIAQAKADGDGKRVIFLEATKSGAEKTLKANTSKKAKRSDLKRMEQDIANKRAELKNARKKMASPDEIRKLRDELDLLGFNYRKARFPKQYG